MIETNACRAHHTMEIDLLPWADPYIMQLFAESEQWSRSGLADSTARTVDRSPETGDDADAVEHGAWYSDSRRVSAPRRPTAPRRRRIESERLLARC